MHMTVNTQALNIEFIMPALEAIRDMGGRPFLVGGFVRDHFFQEIHKRPVESKDIDVEVFGLSFEQLAEALSPFGRVDLVGQSFAVAKLSTGNGDVDFSLPRRDNRKGIGHKGFEVEVNTNMTLEEAASRRDITWNAISINPFTGEIHDPFNGVNDIFFKRVHPVSEAFKEDPLRVLRVAQFLPRFDGWTSSSMDIMAQSIAGEFKTLPKERIVEEFRKLLVKGVRPSSGFMFLKDVGWLSHFPELMAMVGVKQDEVWHPEGTVDLHTWHCLDAGATWCEKNNITGEQRWVIMLGILCHDMGKPATTVFSDGHWRAPAHDTAGVEPSRSFVNSLVAHEGQHNFDLADKVATLTELHMRHIVPSVSSKMVRRVMHTLDKVGLTMEDLVAVMVADHNGRPFTGELIVHENVQAMLDISKTIDQSAEGIKPILMGRHVIAGKHCILNKPLKPGPEVGILLKKAFEAQLDEVFTDMEGALTWLDSQFISPQGVEEQAIFEGRYLTIDFKTGRITINPEGQIDIRDWFDRGWRHDAIMYELFEDIMSNSELVFETQWPLYSGYVLFFGKLDDNDSNYHCYPDSPILKHDCMFELPTESLLEKGYVVFDMYKR